MFDIGAQELLLIVVVAVLVIGPKDLPGALRQAGRWLGKMRRMSGHFRTGLDAMIREAEMEDMEKKWKAQNEAIMRKHPDGAATEMEPTGAYPPAPASNQASLPSPEPSDPTAPTPAPAPAPASAPASAEGAAAPDVQPPLAAPDAKREG